MTRILLRDTSWHGGAACAAPGVDPDIFFLGDTGAPAPHLIGHSRAAIANAKSICAQCPLLERCRAEGLASKERFGIWGGLTLNERLKIWAEQQHQERAAGLPEHGTRARWDRGCRCHPCVMANRTKDERGRESVWNARWHKRNLEAGVSA